MTTNQNIGILGIGTYLPSQVRTNDYWSDDIVAKWPNHAAGRLDKSGSGKEEETTDGAKIILQCMSDYRGDVFRGSRERRVMQEGMKTSDMEIAAAKDALRDAGVGADEIDLLIGATNVPDHLMVSNVCRIHSGVGLPRQCYSIQTETICNAFLSQYTIAEKLIRSGMAKKALLVQSAANSRFIDRNDATSAWLGDAATAVVVGPVADGYGLLGQRHETDGRFLDAAVAGDPERPWYEGRVKTYVKDEAQARNLLLVTINNSKGLLHGALADAGHCPEDVDFYACHQGFAWLRKATQRIAGMTQARSIDTFPWAASCLGCNIPLVMNEGRKEGLLKDGDLVACFSGAAGAVLASLIIRWGRG